jgi:hypothetical protein
MKKLNIEKAVSAIRQNQRDKQKTSAVPSAASPAKMSESEINAQTNEYIGFVWSRVKKKLDDASGIDAQGKYRNHY